MNYVLVLPVFLHGEKAGQRADFSVLYIKRTYVREGSYGEEG